MTVRLAFGIVLLCACGRLSAAPDGGTSLEAGTDAEATCPPATWSSFQDDSKWASVDVSAFSAAKGPFGGAAFDGKYVYFIPTWFGGVAPADTVAARYDTSGALGSSTAWQTFDLATIAPNSAFLGAAYDGRYLYVVGDAAILRHDAQSASGFADPSGWAQFDVTTSLGPALGGFVGAVFDGRWMYFVPGSDNGGYLDVVRYDTSSPFEDAGSWSAFNVANGYSAHGFAGGAFDGRYVYFAPSRDAMQVDGDVVRYDTTADFSTQSSWQEFDLTTVDPGAKGFFGAAFDGRRLYLVPFSDGILNGTEDGIVAAYDTTAPFSSASAWATFDVSMAMSGAQGFLGATFDGRYVYLVPSEWNGGTVVRFDTMGPLTSSASWQGYDCTATCGVHGYLDAVFDGRYVYFAPNTDAVVRRFDARSPACLPPRWNASFL